MSVRVVPLDHPEIAPLSMSDRFRQQITYFMSLPDEPGVPTLPQGEYWVRRENARTWLEDGVISLVSPLDSENRTDVEISEEHETWSEWMLAKDIQHVRIE